MKKELCSSRLQHDPHEWYWKNILRRNCPGLVVGFCGHQRTHGPHWVGEHYDELCNGSGLAGRCPHGVQLLNGCLECAARLGRCPPSPRPPAT